LPVQQQGVPADLSGGLFGAAGLDRATALEGKAGTNPESIAPDPGSTVAVAGHLARPGERFRQDVLERGRATLFAPVSNPSA